MTILCDFVGVGLSLELDSRLVEIVFGFNCCRSGIESTRTFPSSKTLSFKTKLIAKPL